MNNAGGWHCHCPKEVKEQPTTKKLCPICGDDAYKDKGTCGVPGCVEKDELALKVYVEASESKELGNMLDSVDPDNKLNADVIRTLILWTIIELSRSDLLVNEKGEAI